MNDSGQLNEDRAKRKLEQIQSLLTFIKVEIEVLSMTKSNLTILEFGGGSGHVALLLAYLYPQHHIILCERKPYSIQIAQQRIQESGLQNITIVNQEITPEWSILFDVGIALHSCGNLTDVSLSICQKFRASFVIVPCCYGQLVKPPLPCVTQETDEYLQTIGYIRRSNIFLKNLTPKLYEDLVLMADITNIPTLSSDHEICNNSSDQNLDYSIGRTCMNIIDLDRLFHIAELLEDSAALFGLNHLDPWTCSPKNNVIYGRFL